MEIKQFKSTSDDLSKFNGPVTILRPLTSSEADLDEVGPMFRCMAKDGRTFDAFNDELS